MLVNNVSLKINLNNNEQLKFVYSYNKFTKYQDLLEYISFLYPEYNICPCFCFSNNSYYLNNDALIISNNDINGFLKLSNDFGCKCSNNLKKFYRQRKVDIINAFEEDFKKMYIMNNNRNFGNQNNNFNNVNQLQNENNILKNKISALENKIELQKNEIQKLKNGVNPKDDLIKINPLNNQLIGNKYVANTKFEDFYDVIIDIKSVKDINKG